MLTRRSLLAHIEPVDLNGHRIGRDENMSYVFDLIPELEVSQNLKISKSKLQRLRVAGGGPKYIKLGKKVFYRLADLEAWVETCAHNSTSEYTS